ncbi:sugar ABC transporter substrate-binding protein [Fulvivirga sp. M361]|uniref:substrate-binding domain-containing protein n=1 Tax=Fulvivirga sp. M361 TaxID=2594266 RepID=UPI001179A26E|nr:substrate-binding domain-containing protein [Fulvivirga sp. M361]TRX48916.1 sugar ABC transporter substrate-binding protein [Fulvivirga sp. M361]
MKRSFIIKCLLLYCILLVGVKAHAQKVGLLMDSYVMDRWQSDQKLFCDKITELNGEYVVEVAYGDAKEQTRLAQKLIEEGVKVLVLVPVDAKEAANIAAICKKASVPLISYDRLVSSKDVSLYLSYDNEKVGILQATAAVNAVPKGNFLLVNGPVSDNNAILFRRGQLKVLDPLMKKGKVNILKDIVLQDWGQLPALMAMTEFNSANDKKIDCVIAANDAVAIGVISAMNDQDESKNIFITGQDADHEALINIIKGYQNMTVYKPIKPLAELAAQCALKMARGETVENTTSLTSGGVTVKAILLDPVKVDKSNYKSTVVKDGHIELSELMDH